MYVNPLSLNYSRTPFIVTLVYRNKLYHFFPLLLVEGEVTCFLRISGHTRHFKICDKQRTCAKLLVGAHAPTISWSGWRWRSGSPSVFAINGRHSIARCCDKRGFTVQYIQKYQFKKKTGVSRRKGLFKNKYFLFLVR